MGLLQLRIAVRRSDVVMVVEESEMRPLTRGL